MFGLDLTRSRTAPYSAAETLLIEDDSLSLDNNCLHSSGSESSAFESEEDDLVEQPTYKMSQKMAFEVRLTHLWVLNHNLQLFRDCLGHLMLQRALQRVIYRVVLCL
jgi:hypothetical protein